uniref:ATP synthase complex subunit 8 n=1 Tax=Pterygotrigla hemisticta TaxID=1367116 RepID=A0A679DUM6_9TELE|nr:ATPase subunit 8 [Pterygotrigla hemisticta]
MPQLMPAPWFATFAFSWAIILTLVPMKTLAHLFIPDPTLKSAPLPTKQPWAWRWH